MRADKLLNNDGKLFDGPLVLKSQIFKDSRGYFQELWNQKKFDRITKSENIFVQDNYSYSKKGVIRGMHFQIPPKQQGKLIRCISGNIYDVIVDLRKDSTTFTKWAGIELSENNSLQLWVPEGFAHGFLALSEISKVEYKVTNYWSKNHERALLWNDQSININWPNLNSCPICSLKDKSAKKFSELADYEFF